MFNLKSILTDRSFKLFKMGTLFSASAFKCVKPCTQHVKLSFQKAKCEVAHKEF